MEKINCSRRIFWTGLPLTLALPLLLSCSSVAKPPEIALQAAVGALLLRCQDLPANFSHPSTQITSATSLLLGDAKLGQIPLPAHCQVTGKMHERVGKDGRTYAIGFETRLPVDWNGRFFYQGNGGLDGVVRPAFGTTGGEPVTGALHQGFAVISSDAGHSLAQNSFFGYDQQARLDHGYQAVAKLTPMAKALIRAAYGKAPDKSYIGGCSTGGRHAMVAAARMTEQFDGFLVGSPAYRVPYASIANLWAVPKWAEHVNAASTLRNVAPSSPAMPDLQTALTASERQVVAKAILNRCDGLDGALDGMVQNSQACQASFSLQRDVPTCQGTRNGACLSQGQKDVLSSVYAGATDRTGGIFYSAFPWDTGIAGSDWANWKFSISMTLNPVSVGTVFTVPPEPLNPLTADINLLLSRLQATSANFPESGASLMIPPGSSTPTHIKHLHERGGKMIIYHGLSDPIFSAEDTRQWVDRVQQSVGHKSDQVVRYFPVPGMNHCAGGPSTDRFDMLSPLVNWVEYGKAPKQVSASVRGEAKFGAVNPELPRDWAPYRTRPLCAYPAVAKYAGTGSIEAASSFNCE